MARSAHGFRIAARATITPSHLVRVRVRVSSRTLTLTKATITPSHPVSSRMASASAAVVTSPS
eukprot:scaffold14248_cov59-Phaeocystis_antarctica.AAC.4